jgi:hypothetical protein
MGNTLGKSCVKHGQLSVIEMKRNYHAVLPHVWSHTGSHKPLIQILNSMIKSKFTKILSFCFINGVESFKANTFHLVHEKNVGFKNCN